MMMKNIASLALVMLAINQLLMKWRFDGKIYYFFPLFFQENMLCWMLRHLLLINWTMLSCILLSYMPGQRTSKPSKTAELDYQSNYDTFCFYSISMNVGIVLKFWSKSCAKIEMLVKSWPFHWIVQRLKNKSFVIIILRLFLDFLIKMNVYFGILLYILITSFWGD